MKDRIDLKDGPQYCNFYLKGQHSTHLENLLKNSPRLSSEVLAANLCTWFLALMDAYLGLYILGNSKPEGHFLGGY